MFDGPIAAVATEAGADPGASHVSKRPGHLLARARASWTEPAPGRSKSDDELLASWWDSVSLAKIAERLQRSPKAVYQRAKKLGLTDSESMAKLSSVAREMGVDVQTLRKLLRAAAVPTKRAKRDPSDKRRRNRSRGRYSHRLVERDEALRVVEEWVRADHGESLHAAALRLGRNEHWLKRRLVEAEVYVAKNRHGYAASVIDAAVLAWDAARGKVQP